MDLTARNLPCSRNLGIQKKKFPRSSRPVNGNPKEVYVYNREAGGGGEQSTGPAESVTAIPGLLSFPSLVHKQGEAARVTARSKLGCQCARPRQATTQHGANNCVYTYIIFVSLTCTSLRGPRSHLLRVERVATSSQRDSNENCRIFEVSARKFFNE